MGYSSDYKGLLEFKNELTIPQLKELEKYLDEDCRSHKDWDSGELTYIDLQLIEDYGGLEWNGSEKSYDMVEKVNFLTKQMRKKFPKFSFKGHFDVYGEDSGDIWKLVIDENGIAEKQEMVFSSGKTQCPECGHMYDLK